MKFLSMNPNTLLFERQIYIIDNSSKILLLCPIERFPKHPYFFPFSKIYYFEFVSIEFKLYLVD